MPECAFGELSLCRHGNGKTTLLVTSNPQCSIFALNHAAQPALTRVRFALSRPLTGLNTSLRVPPVEAASTTQSRDSCRELALPDPQSSLPPSRVAPFPLLGSSVHAGAHLRRSQTCDEG